jgi:hypothetical protein
MMLLDTTDLYPLSTTLAHTPTGYPAIFATSPVTRSSGAHNMAAGDRRQQPRQIQYVLLVSLYPRLGDQFDPSAGSGQAFAGVGDDHPTDERQRAVIEVPRIGGSLDDQRIVGAQVFPGPVRPVSQIHPPRRQDELLPPVYAPMTT